MYSYEPHQQFQPPVPVSTPGVVIWFNVYCVFMAVMYLGCLAIGIVLLVIDPRDLDMERAEALIMGTIYATLGAVLMVVFVVAPFLPKRKWVWVYDIVLICIGMTSCCTLPATIPLLVFWIKPDARSAFGWT